MRIGTSLTLPFLLPFLPSVFSQVTVYTGIPGQGSLTEGSDPSATVAGPGGFTTNLPAYDTTRLTGPAPIQPPLNGYSIGIPSPELLTASRPLSKPIRGNLLGFSVELSIADSILGTTGEILKPQFLNYLANIQQRSGVGPQVRVGGNSQEGSSIFVEGTANGRIIEKIKVSDYVVSVPSHYIKLSLISRPRLRLSTTVHQSSTPCSTSPVIPTLNGSLVFPSTNLPLPPHPQMYLWPLSTPLRSSDLT